MKKDIEFSPVTGVDLVIAKTEEGNEVKWDVYLINRNLIELTNVMVTSKGYGVNSAGEQKRTSTLRHLIEQVDEQSFALVEPIDDAVFKLNNEFWVSYYILDQIFDKKFIFVPDSVTESNLQYITELDKMGVRHA